MLIIYNAKGKKLNLTPNVVFNFDYIAGDFLVIGDDYEHGDFKSLTEEQIEVAKKDLIMKSFKPRMYEIRNLYNNYGR